jgi:hypothetical protein
MTPLAIEPATSRLIAQCLNQLRHRVLLVQQNTVAYFRHVDDTRIIYNENHGDMNKTVDEFIKIRYFRLPPRCR